MYPKKKRERKSDNFPLAVLSGIGPLAFAASKDCICVYCKVQNLVVVGAAIVVSCFCGVGVEMETSFFADGEAHFPKWMIKVIFLFFNKRVSRFPPFPFFNFLFLLFFF